MGGRTGGHMPKKRSSSPIDRHPDKNAVASTESSAVSGTSEESRQRMKVVKTTRTPSGQTIDWVPIESQGPGGKIATPPPGPKQEMPVVEREHRAAAFEMNDAAAERGPAGTVPLLRRDFSRVANTGSGGLRERKRKVDGRLLTPHSSHPPFADPDPAGYYHATSAEFTTCYGCKAVLNVWAPACQLSSDHSISQFGIQNYDNP